MILPTWLRKISPAELLAQYLRNAEIDRIKYAAAAEEYRHAVSMLDSRIARIRKELQTITNPATKEHE